jgi:hypothetical protein
LAQGEIGIKGGEGAGGRGVVGKGREDHSSRCPRDELEKTTSERGPFLRSVTWTEGSRSSWCWAGPPERRGEGKGERRAAG